MSFIVAGEKTDSIEGAAALLSTYSPRLFGAPPQLTPLNDMRLMSSKSGDGEGAVGDFYLEHVLRDAQIANFTVGKAMFTGGMSSIGNAIRVIMGYTEALNKYGSDSIGTNGSAVNSTSLMEMGALKAAYEQAVTSDDGKYETAKASGLNLQGLGDDIDDITVLNAPELSTYTNTLGSMSAALLTSLSVQQPFYTFESDWYSYINNVRMMINAAITMLGLNNAYVRIGDDFRQVTENNLWSNYKFITPGKELTNANSKDNLNGETYNYVSFMIDPKAVSESYTNSTGQSALYSSVMAAGDSIGREIAFITSSSQNAVDDIVVNLAGDAINAAEKVMTALSGGVGRFTAAIASSMSRSFIGDHTIYPDIFQEHTSNGSSVSMTVKLRASGGDPYSYFIDILVPMFFALGLVLPQMSKNSGAAYTYPPLVQCNIPGIWGTRLGIVDSLTITKNPDGNDISVYGYPLSVDITISVKDLEHVMVTSPMDKPALMLNNHTMFDYIAQCCGVDKYRPNGAMRLITKAIMASADVNNFCSNLGDAVTSDFFHTVNKFFGTSQF